MMSARNRATSSARSGDNLTFRPPDARKINRGSSQLVRWTGASLVAGIFVMAACGSASRPSTTTTSPRAEVTEPVQHSYVGQLSNSAVTRIALLVSEHYAVAYVCNNEQTALLIGGKARAGSASLNNAGGTEMTASYNAAGANGFFTLPGGSAVGFVATPAAGIAGFYQATATTPAGVYSGRWVVTATGQSAGALRLNGTIVENPAIGPTVTVGSTILHPTRTTVVLAYPSSSVFPSNAVYPSSPVKGAG